MRRGKRKARKKEINLNLLHTIYKLQSDWKQLDSFLINSIEPSTRSTNEQHLAQARYMFLLKEARRRNISAIKYIKK